MPGESQQTTSEICFMGKSNLSITQQKPEVRGQEQWDLCLKTWTVPCFGVYCRKGRGHRTDKSTRLTGSREESERAQVIEVARAGKKKQAGQESKQGGKQGSKKEVGGKQAKTERKAKKG